MNELAFFKMQGGGNDFVAVDNRGGAVPAERMAEFARVLCRRAFGVGADGIFFLDAGEGGADVRWDFYNADGSRAEMCGNASRCASRLAHDLGMAGTRLVLATDAGHVAAEIFEGAGEAEVRLTRPVDLRLGIALDMDGRALNVDFVNTGVPHAVVVVPDVDAVDVAALGRAVRFHDQFAPAGTNVNFLTLGEAGKARLRTYERGVEAETLACGTGAAACLAVARAKGLAGDGLDITTSGGERLLVRFEGPDIHLRGGAVLVYQGSARLDELGLA